MSKDMTVTEPTLQDIAIEVELQITRATNAVNRLLGAGLEESVSSPNLSEVLIRSRSAATQLANQLESLEARIGLL